MSKLLVYFLVLSCFIQFGFADDSEEEDDSVEDRAPLSFAFVVLLYNSRDPNRTCPGTAITQWWILDNCEDFPGYEYEFFKNAWTVKNQSTVIYTIHERLHHKDYKRFDLTSQDFDAELLFAAQNALFLHSSDKPIVLSPDIINAIKLNERKSLPRQGHIVYIYRGAISKKNVRFLKNVVCDKLFKSYFDPGKQMLLDDKFICINSTGISPERCCHSQAFLVVDGILTGVMGWSTPCSKEFGVTPWVFTNIVKYLPWLYNYTNVKEYRKEQEQNEL